MKKKDPSKKSVLVELYEKPLLRSKVDAALESGDMSYTEIVELCAEYDLEISPSTLTRYKEKLIQAREENIDVIELLDKRRKAGNIIDIKSKRNTDLANNDVERGELYDETFGAVDKIYNDVQFLDALIQKSAETMKYTDTVDFNYGLRAIEVKSKITGNKLQGLSLVGLRELKLRHEAKQNALLQAIMHFVPEENHKELQEYIAQAEDEFYRNLDLSETDRQITNALREANIDI